jgi:hypothetical protein
MCSSSASASTCPAKHCAIATSRDAMIHAHDGATVCEVAIHPWWGRHLAGVFRFPPLPQGEVESAERTG